MKLSEHPWSNHPWREFVVAVAVGVVILVVLLVTKRW